jgi:N6-L-threonylcarbamoyladenine synthase
LGYPAGQLVEEFARRGDPNAYAFPLPMTDRKDFMLSFSGLKTAARRMITAMETASPLTAKQVDDLCASFQSAVFRSLTYKLHKLLKDVAVHEVWLGGGVAANIALRHELRTTLADFGVQLRTPYSRKLCGDNAAMIGVVATRSFQSEQSVTDVVHDDLQRIPRLLLGGERFL